MKNENNHKVNEIDVHEPTTSVASSTTRATAVSTAHDVVATKETKDDCPEINESNTDFSSSSSAPSPSDPSSSLNNDEMNKPVPQLSSASASASETITFHDLQITSKVLSAIGSLLPKPKPPKKQPKNLTQEQYETNLAKRQKHALAVYQHPNLRSIRKSIHQVYQIHQLQLYTGQDENKYFEDRIQARTLKRQKTMETESQQKYIQNTMLRKGRLEKLNRLKLDAQKEEEEKLKLIEQQQQQNYHQQDCIRNSSSLQCIESCDTKNNGNDGKNNDNDYNYDNVVEDVTQYMIPDGHVNEDEHQNQTMTLQQQQSTTSSNNNNDATSSTTTTTTILPKLRSCYVCKIRYRQLHHFYDQLCPPCASLNYEKRYQTKPLHNKVAIVTGSRVKIGYQTCLKLLRSGCVVVATTRFPNIAVDTYRKERDFEDWKKRLFVYGLDLRDVVGLELFVSYMKMKFGSSSSSSIGKDGGGYKDTCSVNGGGVDILINNACQTVRRPVGYYQPLVEKEERLWKESDDVHKQLLEGCIAFENMRRQLTLDQQQQRRRQEEQQNQLLLENEFGNNSNGTCTGSSQQFMRSDIVEEDNDTVGLSRQQHESIRTTSQSTTNVRDTTLSAKHSKEGDHDSMNNSNICTSPASMNVSTSTSTSISEIQSSSSFHTPVPIPSSSPSSSSFTQLTQVQQHQQQPFEQSGVSHSTAMSQMVILPDDMNLSSKYLPKGMSDINGHQLDLRKTNSWLLKIDQVSTPELIECMFINAIAPFVLNSRLQSLLKTIPHSSNDEKDRPDRYIINVSAMEGKFYRYKMPNHPHTNMAKASLNMMTRTSAEDLAKKHRIFMNSVDTGWINDENPLEKASKIAKKNHFQTPIDEIDAAARILDPIYVGVAMDMDLNADSHEEVQQGDSQNNDSDEKKQKKKLKESNKTKKRLKDYGKFFKDYKETEW